MVSFKLVANNIKTNSKKLEVLLRWINESMLTALNRKALKIESSTASDFTDRQGSQKERLHVLSTMDEL